MTENTAFRTVAFALRDHMTDTYNLLSAADAVVRILPDLVEYAKPEPETPSYRPDVVIPENYLVSITLAMPHVMYHVRDGKKINAIKELRATTGVGLKAAKEAIEHPNVMAFFDRP